MNQNDKLMGADGVTIAKGAAYQEALGKVLKVYPKMRIKKNSVDLYYETADLPAARVAFKEMISPGEPSDVNFNILPVIVEPLLKKYAVHIVLGVAAIYLLSKNV